jgi:hypothetical protein
VRSTRNVALLIDLLPQPAATECVPCALVVDARYIETITTCARFDLEVASWFLSSRLDLELLCRLSLVYVAGGPPAERKGPAMRRILR